MDHVALVRGGKPQRQLASDVECAFRGEPGLFGQQAFQRLAGHVIHADQPCLFVTHEIMNAHDVRRGNLARQQQLLAEALEGIRTTGQLRSQQFEGDVDIQLGVMRVVNEAHATHAEHAQDAEASGNHFPDGQLTLDHGSGLGGSQIRIGLEVAAAGSHDTTARNCDPVSLLQDGAGPRSALCPPLPICRSADISARPASSSSAVITCPACSTNASSNCASRSV